MTIRTLASAVAGLSVLLSGAPAHANQDPPTTIALWPGVAPGDKGDLGVEHDSTKQLPAGGPEDGIIRLANVSKPTITVYRPNKGMDTGAAVVVCPGGGYSILAMNLEGTEVCKWLNSIGVTGVLLKYRVPVRPGQAKYAAPLQDAQRAMGIVRHRAAEWGIDPHRIGILGFSAGGHLAAAASNIYTTRSYFPVDAADQESCKPDFTVLIYPAYLTQDKDLSLISEELKVTKDTPPAFITMTEDDPVHAENALVYTLELKKAGVPVELHLYPTGGHGYGLRPSKNGVSHWPERAAEWMATRGLLKHQ
ncbi:MAG: alpha/beta hydrolase [Chthonomonadales bacterium]